MSVLNFSWFYSVPLIQPLFYLKQGLTLATFSFSDLKFMITLSRIALKIEHSRGIYWQAFYVLMETWFPHRDVRELNIG